MSSTSPLSDADGAKAADGQVSPPPSADESWPDTDHSDLTTLRNGSATERENALRRLFKAYSRPLRHQIRHHWPLLSESDIDDLAADFLTLCLTSEKAHFLTYDPARPDTSARLRTYLRTILYNFLRNHNRSRRAKIRGGDRQFESLDTIRPAAHHETSNEDPGPTAALDIETFDRHWAQHIIGVSFLALEKGSPSTREWLAILRPWILADPGDASLKEIAESKGCSHDAVRAQLHRLRKAWRQAVRDAVARTVAHPAEIDDELRHLAAVLARHPVE